MLVVSDFARHSHLFLYSHTTTPFDAVLFDMEISKSQNAFIATSFSISDRPKSTALNYKHNWKVLKALSAKVIKKKKKKRLHF